MNVIYDANFAARFGAGANSINAARRVVSQAQGFYNLPTLTTTVLLNVVNVLPIPNRLEASDVQL